MKSKREANQEFLRRRQKRLCNNADALHWIKKQGLSDKTIAVFGLGLSELYLDSQNFPHENALLAPVINENGIFTNRTIYLNIPNITVNPSAKAMWAKGDCITYYAEKRNLQPFVIVCEDIFDLWITQQKLRESDSESNFLLISSTPDNSEKIPVEWKTSSFWQQFEIVYLGFHNSLLGERKALQLSRIAHCETKRLRPPIQSGSSWTEFWRQSGKIKEFRQLLGKASIVSETLSIGNDSNNNSLGRFGYKPVDIAAAFHQGHLYYPVETLVNSLDTVKDSSGNQTTQISSRTEVVVIRSDRTIHTVREEAAPRGTPSENRILRLTDGTLLASRPKASVYSTWSWQSIEAYLQNRGKPRSLKTILKDVKAFLRHEVWLPYDYDYDLLTLLVPTTFAQSVFQAVPMILVTGEPGSGKSAIGRAMCQICANAAAVGQISAAGVARLIHETKGFVMLDDLESIGKHSKANSAQFNDLVQALKLSYNKDTSWKVWTDVRQGMRAARLNFFGVKMINNTSGADPILTSRMLRIFTRKIPNQSLFPKVVVGSRNRFNPDSLRDELHTWTFENVELIDATYQRLFPQPSDRAAEIAAPLRVFAEIADDEELAKGLELALSIKNESVEKPADPIDLMMQAVRNIVRAGYREISTTHVTLEMKSIQSRQSINSREPYRFKAEKWESPAWVGRHLRTYGFVEINVQSSRFWLFGKSLRIYPVKNEFLKKIADENEGTQDHLKKKPLDFCSGCGSCDYRELNCPLMSSRKRAEN